MRVREPVVFGKAGDGPLNETELAQYAEEGFLHFPGFLNNETIYTARKRLAYLRKNRSLRTRPDAITEPESGALRSVFAVHLGTDALAVLCRDPHLTAIARQILASDVYILQSRVNYKPGFRGKEFFWHSDFET